MASSNQARNKAIMNSFIKQLKAIPGDFDNVIPKILDEKI